MYVCTILYERRYIFMKNRKVMRSKEQEEAHERWSYDRWMPCLIPSICFYYMTRHQEDGVASIIKNTTVTYAIVYQLLRWTGWFQPTTRGRGKNESSRNPPLKYSDAAEWRSRVIGTMNAVILIVGSVLCFLEWPSISRGEGFIQTVKVWRYPVTFASLFVGYLQWDFCWLIYHYKENKDVSSLLHHTLFILITHYVLSGTTMTRPFAWLSLTELSTPFLHVRWFFAVSGKKTSIWYTRSSILFAFTFLLTRVFGYTLGLLDLWCHSDIWLSNGPWGLHIVVLGLHAGWILNLFWGIKVISAMTRMIRLKTTL